MKTPLATVVAAMLTGRRAQPGPAWSARTVPLVMQTYDIASARFARRSKSACAA